MKKKITLEKQNHEKIYNEFKEEYLRICKELGKEGITSREYDHYTKYLCRTVLSRELHLTYTELVKKAGLQPVREFITPGLSKKINDRILQLRLEGNSYFDISINLNCIDLSGQTIMRRLNKMYPLLDKETQLQLDKVKEQTIRGRYWKQI